MLRRSRIDADSVLTGHDMQGGTGMNGICANRSEAEAD
jgi:hypothetical protein